MKYKFENDNFSACQVRCPPYSESVLPVHYVESSPTTLWTVESFGWTPPNPWGLYKLRPKMTSNTSDSESEESFWGKKQKAHKNSSGIYCLMEQNNS